MGVNFRYKNVGGEGFDLIRLSYSNMEQIINKFLHKEKEIEFRQAYIRGNLWMDDFFDIYFSSIHESFLDDTDCSANGKLLYPATWKLGDEEFFSFHDCLLFHLLSKFSNKKNYSLKEIQSSEPAGRADLTSLSTRGGSYNMRDGERRKYLHNYISQIIKNKKILPFAISLVDNLIEYKKHSFYSIVPDSQEIDDKVKDNVKELFFLLRDYRKVLLPYLDGCDLERYFPHNIDYSKEEQDKKFDELLNRIIKFKKTSKMVEEFVRDNVLLHQHVKNFTERNGVFYEITGFPDASFFNQKTKIIFPILYDFVNQELDDRVEKLLNPKLQKVTIVDRYTGKQEMIPEPVSIWLDAKETIKRLSQILLKDDKNLKKIESANNLKEMLQLISEPEANKTKRGRKPISEEVEIWKKFIESLDGEFCDTNKDCPQQAYDAYCKLDSETQRKLAFVQNDSVTKQNIVAHLLEKTERKMGGKTTLNSKIATPFAEKFPKNSSR